MLRNLLYRRATYGWLSPWSKWWIHLRFHWHASNKLPWLFALAGAAVIVLLGLAIQSAIAHNQKRRDLTCLAANVYYEARGERAAGRYAVAEVTMNRVASGRYPQTVCEVVYQKNWDPLRGRYVSAFSWTEFDSVPPPQDEHWQVAWDAAEAVYYGRRPPVLKGAVLYHATYIRPSWARGKRPVARIGRHVFYR